ncbi:FIVAR domain-containing protein [Cohnella ginsengisoli]|uniref:FIVAR domain-containing protein n=1 Tax=Cohnella ginsengisoli TaxID=425004 RepID=A0A9X4QLC4_9BACL|nr:FIVAR domain-containing protein [Cohnella ginsengisoli]MDG0790041.1 FIVAR domain-containing protein [Cohnella ginsengisoli]
MAYSWNDGMAGYETGNNDSGFIVLFPQNRNAGAVTGSGYDITVAQQPRESTVVFGIGMWQSEVDVNIYANGLLYGTKKVSASSTAQVYKYQIKAPAGVTLKLEVRQTKTLARDGNMSFSGLAVSSKEVAEKINLKNAYTAVKDIVQGLYTDDSWQSFVTARDGAKTILDKANATQSEVDGAISALSAAQTALVRKVTNIMIDYTGAVKGEYEFGSPGDQQDRYQTFTAKENFDMELVQFKLKMIGTTPSDLVVRLYNTTGAGLPTGSPLAEATVSEKWVADGDFTTAKLQYSLVKDKRYAVVLSQTALSRDQYRWLVMAKNNETNGEYFGKSVSGAFQHEASLGTGILRIVKNTFVNRNDLQTRIDELRQYSSRLYTMQSWAVLQRELQQAIVVANNVDASQEVMDAALELLNSAAGQLQLYTSLENIAAQVDDIGRAIVKGYTENSIHALNDTLNAVKALDVNASDNDKIKAYSNVMNTLANLESAGKYKYETNGGMTAAFGFEGDKNASLAFADGSYQIGGGRPMQHGPVAPKQMVTFGVTDTSDIKWYNGEGYLPVFISEYTKDDVRYKIENFANKHSVDNKDYVVDYSRITAVNDSNETRLLPLVSNNLIALNEAALNSYVIEAGQTVVREYAIEADKYEYFDNNATSYTSLTREQVAAQGSFADNYDEMKAYWNSRLSELVDIELPNSELVNAFKAGYINTMIIKDKTYLHVGENGYARLFSHDTIGIMVQLIQSGDFHYAKDYLRSIPLTGGVNIEMGQVDPDQYWDANWKLPWAYAVYLSKTGDASIFQETMTADDGSVGTVFEKRVKVGARSIESDRTSEGIMKKTWAIDSEGYWTTDDYSALMGLTAYEYITRELYRIHQDEYYLNEAEWAKAQYDDLLEKFTARLQQTITEKGLNYIPASVTQSNDENRMQDSRDANWASMYLFGRWLWDGYLYGAEQPADNINLTMLDSTYEYGIDRRWDEGTTDSDYNFGGYPHGFYSSSYNAGYGSSALRGEAHRDIGIKAYEFMIEKSMSGPFSWWEGIAYPAVNSPWATTNDKLNVQNTPGGGGSAQHMWGQAVNSKVLIDSLIAERIYDQNQKYEIIVGRGIPKEWVLDAANNQNVVAKVNNYPAFQGGRVGYNVVRNGNKLVVTLNAQLEHANIDVANATFSIQLPSMVNNIIGVSTGIVDNAKGTVKVPLSTQSVTITLGDLPGHTDLELDHAALAIGYANGDSNLSITQDVTLPTAGEKGSAITWSSNKPEIISNAGKVVRPSDTTEVTLTATLRKDGEELQKTFALKVLKKSNRKQQRQQQQR